MSIKEIDFPPNIHFIFIYELTKTFGTLYIHFAHHLIVGSLFGLAWIPRSPY